MLEVLAQERRWAIEQATEMRRTADVAHTLALGAAREHQRNANRALVEGIDAAQEFGIKQSVILERVGFRRPRLHQLKRDILAWDHERQTTAA